MEVSTETLHEYRDKWEEIGMQTGSIDPEATRPFIDKIYASAGFKAPKFIFHAKNPVDLIKKRKAIDIVEKELYTSADPYQLLQREADKLKSEDIEFKYGEICFGNHDASTLAFYDFFLNHEKLEEISEVDHFLQLARVCSWWIPLEDAAIVMDRPSVIKQDDAGELHCENGPAIKFDDKFEVYAWHGLRIPSEWIRDKSLTPQIALTFPQVELRRAACEILGWHNVLEALNKRVVDKNDNPQVGTLLEVDIPEIGTEKFLFVECGTGRNFAIPVPPDVTTALEANAWSYGVAANEYMPEVRT